MIAGIIPARLGSKGVPKKNIKNLAGKPLLYWTVKAAIESELDKVFITSETGMVSAALWPHLTEQEKGKVYFLKRPPELSQDRVQVDEVVLFSLRQIQYIGMDAKAIVVLQPTSPFRKSSDINRAIITYEYLAGKTSVISGCKVDSFVEGKYYWEGGVSSGMTPIGHDPLVRRGRQWVEPWVVYKEKKCLLQENGAIYVASREKIEDYKTFRAPPYAPVYMDKESSLEIDTPEDWDLAESLRHKLDEN